MLAAISLIVVVLFLSVYFKQKDEKDSTAHPLPPIISGGYPIFGHIWMLWGNNVTFYRRIMDIAKDCLKQGGMTYSNLDLICYYITDPEDALTAANVCLDKAYSFDYLQNWLGFGMITSKAHIWKQHRKLFHPTFSPSIINSFVTIFNTQAEKFVKDFEVHCGKGLTDVTITLANNVLETSSLTVYGQVKKNEQFRKYKDALDAIGYMVVNRYKNFWVHSDFMYSLLGYQKQEDEYLKTTKAVTNEVFYKEKAKVLNKEENSTSEDEKLNTFCESMTRIGVTAGLTDIEIIQEVDTVIAASFDTTTNQLLYIYSYLGSYPEVQEKLHNEIIEVIGENGSVDKDSLSKLVYTEAVIKEVMRLQPTTPYTARAVTQDVKLKNYTMRAGAQCVILFCGINLHPSWGDPEVFRPERWLERDPLPPASLFCTFGMGKRACAGRNYAILSMKTNLAHTIRAYRIKGDHTKLVCSYGIAVKPVAGHEIIIEKRK